MILFYLVYICTMNAYSLMAIIGLFMAVFILSGYMMNKARRLLTDEQRNETYIIAKKGQLFSVIGLILLIVLFMVLMPRGADPKKMIWFYWVGVLLFIFTDNAIQFYHLRKSSLPVAFTRAWLRNAILRIIAMALLMAAIGWGDLLNQTF